MFLVSRLIHIHQLTGGTMSEPTVSDPQCVIQYTLGLVP
jgi:hypothetical protein